MKKLIFTLTASILLSGAISILLASAIFTSCNTGAEKVDNAKSKAVEADENFNKVNEEYLTDIENFKKETAAKIDANNLMIADFKAKTASAKKEAKAYYEEQIAVLEQKNIEMKAKLDAYEENGKDNWEIFKAEFSRDMNDLGEAFKNFTIKNE
ncbi:MAG: hypothetical protein JJE44_12355 [Flavobacteriaceae bacterium]|nr:hypothetical protein [Flavobacteriaceae bacterium]